MKYSIVPLERLFAVPLKNGIYKSASFHGRGQKIVNMKELFAFNFIGDQEMKRVELNEAERAKNLLREGDLLFGRRSLVEEGAGKVSYVSTLAEETTFESSIIRVRLDLSIAHPKFYYYYFSQGPGRNLVHSLASGTNVIGIRGSDLKNLDVIYPAYSVQVRIADFLSAYDDLIANNLHRIKLLEEAARCRYKVMIGETESHSVKVGSLAKLIGGYAFKSKDWCTMGAPVIKIKNIDNNTVDLQECDCVPDDVANKAAKFELFEGDLVVAMTGATVGKIGLMPKLPSRYFLNQRVGVFRTIVEIDVTPVLFCAFREPTVQQQVLNLAGGAAQPNISGGQIESIELIIPKDWAILRDFCEGVKPNLALIATLKHQNRLLREACDILLTRLMNGEMDIASVVAPQTETEVWETL